jgi:hypothetical protein
MTEDQVRNVLARVVPEPPDSVADPAPVVRRARQRRRVIVAGATGLAAVLVAGTLLGVRSVGDDEPDQVVDTPRTEMVDPYTTAPCPDPSDRWLVTPVAELDQVTRVRYCPRPMKDGGAAATAPLDALVDDVPGFVAAVRALPDAEETPCTIAFPDSDDRLLLELADGTSLGVAANYCWPVEVDGRTVHGHLVTMAFLDALRAQRDARDYGLATAGTPLDCDSGGGTISPAVPGGESLTEAVVCPSGAHREAVVLDDDALRRLQRAWDEGERPDDLLSATQDPCGQNARRARMILARTDRGEPVMLFEGPDCDIVTYETHDVDLPYFRLDVTVAELLD